MNRPCPKKICLTVLVGSMAFAPLSVLAQSQQTDIRPQAQRVMGEDIRTQFEGRMHHGAYNFTQQGRGQNTYKEMHFPDGRVIYKEGEAEAKGVWFINKDTLCFVYQNDLLNGGCFRVYKVENCFYYYSDQIREEEGELDRDYWTARSVIDGETPQCEAAIS